MYHELDQLVEEKLQLYNLQLYTSFRLAFMYFVVHATQFFGLLFSFINVFGLAFFKFVIFICLQKYIKLLFYFYYLWNTGLITGFSKSVLCFWSPPPPPTPFNTKTLALDVQLLI